MNSSRYSTREKAIDEIPTGPIVTAESNSKPESVIVEHEASINRPDVPTFSNLDNGVQNPCSNPGLSTSIRKKNFCTRKRASIINKRSVVLKPLASAKKITKNRLQRYNDGETKTEQASSSEITRRIEHFGKNLENLENFVSANGETSRNLHQDFTYSNDVEKVSEIAVNDKRNFTNKLTPAHEETRRSNKEETLNKMRKNTEFYIPRDKASKIPRIKPSSFSSAHEESRVYSGRKLEIMGNKFKRSTNAKSSTARSEEESYVESGDSPKGQVSNVVDYQKLKHAAILRMVLENPTNVWCLEKSSEMDADEELDGDLSASPINEPRIITGAGDDPRSVTLLRSLALKCKCPSCNNHKHVCDEHEHTPANRSDRHTESDSWSSAEVANIRKWKLMKQRKLADASTEDSNLLSDCDSGINYTNVRRTGKNNGISHDVASRVKRSSATNDPTRMNVHRTASFSFFNVFFDIVFWPFVFLRAKR